MDYWRAWGSCRQYGGCIDHLWATLPQQQCSSFEKSTKNTFAYHKKTTHYKWGRKWRTTSSPSSRNDAIWFFRVPSMASVADVYGKYFVIWISCSWWANAPFSTLFSRPSKIGDFLNLLSNILFIILIISHPKLSF